MKKILLYSLLTVGVVGLVSASAVSAQGFFYNRAMDSAGGYERILENKAEILGLSVDDLKAAKEEGQTFQEIAENQGLSIEELRAQMQEKKQELRAQKMEGMKAHIEELVANEEITQERADYKIQKIQERFENFEARGKMFYRNAGAGRFMNCPQGNL